MARTITFDFASGGVGSAGRLVLAGTSMTTTGTTVNLPPVKVAYLEAGLASIPDVEPTPVAADGWRYQVKLETDDGAAHWWIVSVPDGTAPIAFSLLPVIEATSFPIDQTGTQIETWMQSVRAQATAANANATQALELINQYHGVDGVPAPFKTVDSWEQKKIITYSDGSVKAIPYDHMPPGEPLPPTAVPGSTMITITWANAAPAVRAQLLRNGIEVYSGIGVRYTDKNVVAGSTYFYSLITHDQWGQRSIVSATVTAGVDLSLNMAPNCTITTWPNPLPQTGQGLIRVCASDGEGQTLVLGLTVGSGGTVTPTLDPSVWIFTA